MARRDAVTWETLQASLDGYHPEQLAPVLRAYLTPRVPPGTRKLPEDTRKAMAEDVKVLVREHLGPWYTHTGVELGNESMGGYCWCHAFFNERPVPNLGVEYNVQRILKALGFTHEWLCKLDALFQELKRDFPPTPGDEDIRALALTDAIVRAVQLTEEATGCEEAWYTHAWDALSWLFQSQGIRPDYAASKLMNKLFVFESWHGLSDEELRAGAEQVAFAAIAAEVHRRSRK